MSLQRRALLAGFVGGLIVPQRAFAIVRSESLMRIKPVVPPGDLYGYSLDVNWDQFQQYSQLRALLRRIRENEAYELASWFTLRNDIVAGMVASLSGVAHQPQTLSISKSSKRELP